MMKYFIDRYDPSKSADAKVSKSHAKRPQFRVIVADSRPHLEGRQTVRRLVAAGIPCTYVYLNALSHVMPSVTKVFYSILALIFSPDHFSFCFC
jgi:translation initiation factor eIF-2B subunit delta